MGVSHNIPRASRKGPLVIDPQSLNFRTTKVYQGSVQPPWTIALAVRRRKSARALPCAASSRRARDNTKKWRIKRNMKWKLEQYRELRNHIHPYTVMENQVEKNMENEMETGVISGL